MRYWVRKLRNSTVQGIRIGNTNKRHEQYADDLWATIIASQQNLDKLMAIVDSFSHATGLTINYNKTKIMRIGSLRDSNAKYYTENQVIWSDKVRVLGITMTADPNAMISENYDELLNKMKIVLNPWKARTLSLMGRVQVINSLIVSLATHKFMCLPHPSPDFFIHAKKLITSFLWKNGKVLIAYKQIIQSIEDGGLKLIDLELKDVSLKTHWIARMCIPKAIKPFWEQCIEKYADIHQK